MQIIKRLILVLALAVLCGQVAEAQYVTFNKDDGGIDVAKCGLSCADDAPEGVKIAVKKF